MYRNRRGPGTTAALIASVVLQVLPAYGQSAVLSSPPESAELRELRVAIANGPNQSTSWLGVRIEGAADEVHVIVPAPPESRIDLSSDAWFEALADSTHTRVLPPVEAPEQTCPEARLPETGEYDLIGDVGHVETVRPFGTAQVMTFSQVVSWVQGKGLSLSFDGMSVFAGLDEAGYRFVKLQFDVPAGNSTLRTIRVTSPSMLATIPLVVTSAGAAPVELRAWVFESGRAEPGGLPWTMVDPSKVRWSVDASGPRTNYRALLGSAFDAVASATWVLDFSTHGAIFRTVPMHGGISSVPALVEGYFDRAAGYGDAPSDPSGCIARVAALESSLAQVSQVCAAGAVVSLNGSTCVEEVLPGQTEAEDLRCGASADDLALAMTGRVPEGLWLTRWTGRLPAWMSRSAETVLVQDGEARSAVVESGDWDTSVCEVDGGAGGGTGGTGGGGTVPPNTGGTGVGGGGYLPEDPYYEDDSYYEDYGTQVYLEGSCWGDTSSTRTADDGDSCSGDSSNGDSSCSGDSSSSGSDDGACSGDSSDSEGDSCSGDSSDSSSDDSCSGDTSDSSSSSDSCSGDSSDSSSDSCGSSDSNCAMVRSGDAKKNRLPTSAFTLFLVASGLMARRFRREAERNHPFR